MSPKTRRRPKRAKRSRRAEGKGRRAEPGESEESQGRDRSDTPDKPHGPSSLFGEDTRYYGLLVGLCFAAAVIFRLAYLSADPPWNFTWSQALFTDGARAIDGARDRLLFGQWIVDMRSPVVLFYPLVNLLAVVIFKVGGIGLVQANLVGALPALVTVSLAYLWVRKLQGKLAGLVMLVPMTFCYMYVVYCRVPMVESLLILMLLASFYLALKDRLGLFLSGLLVGLAALMVKMHALHLVPVVIVYLLIQGRLGMNSPTGIGSRLLSFLGGLAVALAVWLAFVYTVNPEIVAKYFRSNILISQKGEYAGATAFQVIERRIGALIHVGSGRDAYFFNAPVLSLTAVIGLICVVSGFVRRHMSAKPWEVLAAIWFVGLVSALSFLSYRPLRYMVLLTPSLALLSTSLIIRIAAGRPLIARHKPSWFTYAFAIWLAWVLIHLQHDVIYRMLSGGAARSQMSLYRFHLSVWPKILIFGGIGVAVTLLFGRRIFGSRMVLRPGARRGAVVIILVGMALLNTVKFAGFASERKYSIVEGARSLDRVLSDGVFLVGDCATTMSLEADFRTLPAYGDLIRYDEREQFERYPITHFILRFPTLYEYLQKHYPGFSESIAAVRTFPLCGRDATIVRYEAWPGFAKSGYKPSDFEVAMGLLQAGQFEQASGVFEAFLAARSDSYEALVGLAICRMRSGRSDDAVALMEQALEITDRDALSYEIYGDLLSNLGRDTEARAQWHEALKLNPNSRNLRSKLGMRRR